MGDAENALPPSKKRAAGREISRDNPGLDEEEGSSEQENGTFKRASDEVLANRRIVKVRRNQTTSTASSNPFSGIRLVPPTEPTFAPAASSGAPESRATTTEVITEAPIVDEKEVPEDGESDVNRSEKNEEGNNQQSEKTDEKDPGSVKSEIENIEQSESKEGPVSEAFADKESTENKGSTVLNEETQEEANDEKRAGDVSTKDEDKKDDETANADSSAEAGTEGARVLMRARGNYRLILNARLYPDMKLTNMDKRGITFACMNSTSEEKEGLSTFALKFKDASIVEEFRAALTAHQSNTTDVLKAPENSPKASED
ncbi:hypothetical protein GQ457_09G007150 [Hibiscus cannabinus]